MLPFSHILACKAMGEVQRAVILLRLGVKFTPGNVTMKKELVTLEMEAEMRKERDPERYQAIEDAILASFSYYWVL